MTCIGTGQITEGSGFRDAFQFAAAHPEVGDGVLRVVSESVSGVIGIRGGRFIIGADAGNGALSGHPALKQLLSLKKGLFYYMTGPDASGGVNLEQSLGVDMNVLLSGSGSIVSNYQSLAQERGWEFVTEFYAPQPQYMGDLQPDEQLNPAKPAAGTQPAGDNFGDSFLDRIAWSVSDTFARMKAFVPKRELQPPDERAAKVFNDLDDALAKSGKMGIFGWTSSSKNKKQQPKPEEPKEFAPENFAPQQFVPGRGWMSAEQLAAEAAGIGGATADANGSKHTVDEFSPDDVRKLVNPQNPMATQQKMRTLSAEEREARARLQAERNTESQRLRTIDIMEAADTSKRQKKPFRLDLSSFAAVFLVLGIIGVGVVGVRYVAQVADTDRFLKSGQKYLDQKKPELAVTEFTLYLDKNPNNIKALLLRGQAYESGNQLEQAKQDFDAITRQQPNDAKSNYRSALIRIRLCQFKEARPFTTKLLKENKKDDIALALNGIVLAGLGEYEHCLMDLGKVKDESKLPPFVAACANGARGYSYYQTNQPEHAIKCYDTAIKLLPQNDGFFREQAACYAQLGDYKNQISNLEHAIELAPSNGFNYLELAKAYDGQKNFDKAIQAYKDAIKLTRNPSDLYCKLAKDEIETGHCGEALTACDLALRIDPDNKEAPEIRALAESKEKSAKPIAIAGIGKDDDEEVAAAPVDPLFAETSKLISAGKSADAEKLLQQAIAAQPSNYKIRIWLANCFVAQGKAAEAYSQFSYVDDHKALPLQNKLTFAECAAAAGHPDREMIVYSDCINEKPDWVAARVKLLQLLVKAGLNDRATEVLHEGIAVAKNDEEKQTYLRACGLKMPAQQQQQ